MLELFNCQQLVAVILNCQKISIFFATSGAICSIGRVLGKRHERRIVAEGPSCPSSPYMTRPSARLLFLRPVAQHRRIRRARPDLAQVIVLQQRHAVGVAVGAVGKELFL